VDPEKGTLTKDEFVGRLKDRILVFEEGAGSTVGSYVIYNLRLSDNAPLGMIMSKADAIITIGCILADIPLLNRVDERIMQEISTGDILEMDPVSGKIAVWKGT
jgi:predicted aconitase with swiveling domain